MQSEVSELGVLCEIADQGKKQAQEDFMLHSERKRMLIEDTRYEDQNEAAYALALEEEGAVEARAFHKFDATVKILTQLMEKWSGLVKERQRANVMVLRFQSSIAIAFQLGRLGEDADSSRGASKESVTKKVEAEAEEVKDNATAVAAEGVIDGDGQKVIIKMTIDVDEMA